MFVLVRDEDPPTVAQALGALVEEEGFTSLDMTQISNPLEAIAMLDHPHVMLSQSPDAVFLVGLETLDLFEADEWGQQLSQACEAEVIVIEPAEDGVRVYVCDDGEIEETIDIPLDPSGRTRSEALADITDSEEGAKELEAGIAASAVEQLVPAIMRCLGVDPSPEGTISLAFHDPLSEAEAPAEQEPGLLVEALPAAQLVGTVGGEVASPHGSAFAIVLVGASEITGVRLRLTDSPLLEIEELEISMRIPGGLELTQRTVRGKELVFELPDAFLEGIDLAPPALDMSDLFSSMQRMMSSGEARVLNTITVLVTGTGLKAGEGELTLEAIPSSSELPGSAATIPIRVVNA